MADLAAALQAAQAAAVAAASKISGHAATASNASNMASSDAPDPSQLNNIPLSTPTETPRPQSNAPMDPLEAVKAAALAAANKISVGGYVPPSPAAPLTSFSNSAAFTKSIKVPQDAVGRLIGMKGAVIQKIQEDSCCKVITDQSTREQGFSTFTLQADTEDQLQNCESRISQLLEDAMNRSSLHPSMRARQDPQALSEEMTVPSKVVGAIIGPKGTKIKEIQHYSNAFVQINPEGLVQMRASTSEDMQKAKDFIKSIVEEVESREGASQPGDVECIADIHNSCVGWVIGPRGSAILQLRQISGARVSVEAYTEDTHRLVIAGPPGCVIHAYQLVFNKLQGRVSLVQPPSCGLPVEVGGSGVVITPHSGEGEPEAEAEAPPQDSEAMFQQMQEYYKNMYKAEALALDSADPGLSMDIGPPPGPPGMMRPDSGFQEEIPNMEFAQQLMESLVEGGGKEEEKEEPLPPLRDLPLAARLERLKERTRGKGDEGKRKEGEKGEKAGSRSPTREAKRPSVLADRMKQLLKRKRKNEENEKVQTS